MLGLMADTHDNLPRLDEAIKRLNEHNVELVLHAGDYVSPFVIPHFKELKAKLVGVLGNNDGDRELLKQRFSENERLEMRGTFAELTLDSLKIALLHGSERELLTSVISCGGFDVIVHAHSHNAETYRKGTTLVVNPGETCAYLTGKSTIALLDTVEREANILEI